MKSRVYLHLFIFLLFSTAGAAQQIQFEFNLVSGPVGKPLGKIRNITQDPQGYMWFSGESERCIYRYDGVRLITFRHDDADPNSLGAGNINSVYADNSGMIWIGLDFGLDQFNPSTGIFRHYLHIPNDAGSLGGDVAPVIKDHQGRLWVGGSKGLDRLNEKTGKFTRYRNEPGNEKSLSSNFVWAIYEDREGVIWVGTGEPWSNKNPEDGGLNRLEADGTFTRFMHDPKNSHSLINNKIAAIFEDSRGTFWVGTSGDGLHTMDRRTGSFERHIYNAQKPDQLSRPPLNPKDTIIDKINFITEDSTGAIWIGTEQSGINRYDPKTAKTILFKHSNGFPDSTSWNAFTSKEGELWITTEDNNLYRVNPFHKTIHNIFTGYPVNNFFEDDERNLWVSTVGNGLLKFDRNENLIKQFKHDPLDSLSLSDNRVGTLFHYQRDTFLVNCYSGIRRFNKRTNQFSRFNANELFNDSKDNGFTIVFRDKQGIVWFGTWGKGLIRYDPKNTSFKNFLNNTEDSATLGSNYLNGLLQDTSGRIWATGNNGINRLDEKTGRFKHYLSKVFIFYFYQDLKKNLWAGTQQGLYRYDPKQDQFIVFFDSDSEISSLPVGGIIEDDDKNLWLASPSSIIKANPATKETFIYGKDFGIHPNTLAPYAKTYKDKEGRLFIGYDNGFYIFHPHELDVTTDFKIIITDLFINTVAVLPGKESIIQKPVEEIGELNLKYNQNNIALNFSAIDYRDPHGVQYFTKLDGYDDVWREAKEEKSSRYFNLPRGKFIYHIKAYNKDGTKAEKIITITINPPWWQTWWAYSLYIFLLIIAIWGFIKWRTRALSKEKIVLEEKVALRTSELRKEKEIVENTLSELRTTQTQLIQSEKMASLGELTAGIAHEIQNPLNFVNNFSEVNKELLLEMKDEIDKGNIDEVKSIANDIIDNEEKINHHGKRADAIVKGMLQHSRSSSTIKEPTDINALADEYLRLTYHGLRAKEKSFNAIMKTDFDEGIGKINIVPQDIGRVLLNLINNAFYAVTEKNVSVNSAGKQYEPTVTLITKKAGSTVQIIVKDNGDGIPQKVRDKIFQPFFTTKPTGQGTGLGLSLSYDIIKAHGGEIKVFTKDGEGTEFTIQLPDK